MYANKSSLIMHDTNGFTCGRCGTFHPDKSQCARFTHEFAYRSPYDGDLIDATLCDACAHAMFADLIRPAHPYSEGSEHQDVSILNPGTDYTNRLETNVFRPLVRAIERADLDHAEICRVVLATIRKVDQDLVSRLVEVLGNVDTASEYLCSKNVALGGASPLMCLTNGRRQDVIEILNRIEHAIVS